MASSSGLDLKAARHLSAALQITFDRAQAVGSLRLFRPHHFQQLSKQRQGIGLTIQLSCPLKPATTPPNVTPNSELWWCSTKTALPPAWSAIQ